ncbi:transmembrane sensor [Parabacteroides sp. PF5-5]|uniref:FecR family protein n=1 Tax=unclassified Parabacteroides TaxID=2649774 RepID=UPI0024746623|nr:MULTISPECIES: FecR family protein [unclassified Parabacteroides]MDH6304116.1 transmembrane sensor [Parabacteroides sp. PH5-39]MDH6315184.1 transmembrane sensor [Parabacteroides sp. PF5-13]MDH6318829.1 transmembrane sensor [Parabacteroides sp. PH5-13]MDH6322558.1 transmembrane sensor [Parabacteroides sp. PH5-8]MDH6326290.1 transmembrane sensor [Parabacteroides sp. PH5-41]
MKINRDILIRYFSGECTESEKSSIQKWLEEDETHKKQFINERIRFDASLMIDENKMLHTDYKAKGIIWNIMKIAAAFLILVGSSYLFSLYQDRQGEMISQNIHVPTGNRTSITLPDGTLVWLNSNTTLKYPSRFSKKERIVELDGEAYFEVTKDKKKTFIVKTNKYNIEVLGTTFNVEAYNNKETFSAALFTGRIKLYQEEEKETSIFLNKGECAKLVDNTLQISPIQSETYRWRDGLIIIENKSFEEVMLLLEKYFGQEIIIENKKVKDLGYQGKLRIADGVDHALRVLQNDYHFTYKRDETMSKIYIY